MNNPPNPGIPALLLAAAQRLGWHWMGHRDAAGVEVGCLSGDGGETRTWLRLAGAPDRRVTWALEGDALIPHALTAKAYAVLHDGTLREDNTLTCEGRVFSLISRWDERSQIAIADVIEVQGA